MSEFKGSYLEVILDIAESERRAALIFLPSNLRDARIELHNLREERDALKANEALWQSTVMQKEKERNSTVNDLECKIARLEEELQDVREHFIHSQAIAHSWQDGHKGEMFECPAYSCQAATATMKILKISASAEMTAAKVVELRDEFARLHNENDRLRSEVTLLQSAFSGKVFACEDCGTEWTETKPAENKWASCNHGDNCPLCNGKCRSGG